METEGTEGIVNNPTEGIEAVENNQVQTESKDFNTLPKWTAGLSNEIKEQHFEELMKSEKMSDVVGRAFEADKKLSNAIFKPGEDATDEDMLAYKKAMGLPTDISELKELFPGEEGNEKSAEALTEFAFKNNLSTEQAKALSDLIQGEGKSISEKFEADKKIAEAETEKTLISEYGEKKYKEGLEHARRMIRNHPESAGLVDYLDSTGLGNNPDLTRFLIDTAMKLSDDTLDEGKGRGFSSDNYYDFPNTEGM